MKVEFIKYPDDGHHLGAKLTLRPESAEERQALAEHNLFVGFESDRDEDGMVSGKNLVITWSWKRIKENKRRNELRAEAARASQEAWRESMQKDRDYVSRGWRR